MMMLNEKALEAFHKELSQHINHDNDAYASEITAYLAALPSSPVSELVDMEEALSLAEVGEYLYSERAYFYGDGQTEPREYGIEWQWQQSKPNEFGQGLLLAEAARWHEEQSEDGTPTEATKLRTHLTALAEENAKLREAVSDDDPDSPTSYRQLAVCLLMDFERYAEDETSARRMVSVNGYKEDLKRIDANQSLTATQGGNHA